MLTGPAGDRGEIETGERFVIEALVSGAKQHAALYLPEHRLVRCHRSADPVLRYSGLTLSPAERGQPHDAT